MEIIFGCPGYYLQGPDILKQIYKPISQLHIKFPLILTDKGVLKFTDVVRDSLEKENIKCDVIIYDNQITVDKINELISSIQKPYDAVIGIGGGKTIDVAKRISWAKSIKMISVPTSVATDACTSRTSVAYGPNYEIAEEASLSNPDAIVVDSAVVIGAPIRLFRAGFADAVSKRYEYLLSLKCGQKNWYNGDSAFFIDSISNQMHSLLLENGRYLHDCFEKQKLNGTVENGILAMLLMSRLVWDPGGLHGAHDFFEEFHDAGYGHDMLHGEIVGFFDLVQLLLEDYPEGEFEKLYSLYHDLHIPLKISQLGFPIDSDDAMNELLNRMMIKCSKFGFFPSIQKFRKIILSLEIR